MHLSSPSPEWTGAPDGVLPRLVATELVFAETEQHAVHLVTDGVIRARPLWPSEVTAS